MKLIVNGEEKTLESQSENITNLLEILKVKMPEMVSVELNDEIIPRDQFENTTVKDNDRIEFIYFMGGGSHSWSEDQMLRYSRHFLLPQISLKGQEQLLAGSVLIIGAGGLGSPAAFYLAASGVGRIGLVDYDKVDLSNLQRQIIHKTDDVGKYKVDSAARSISKLNPDVKIEKHNLKASAENLPDLVKDYDFILDCVDSFNAKFMINDTCVIEKKAFSHAGALQFQGQTFTHVPGSGCLRCIFHEVPKDSPTCADSGILGPVVGLMGILQSIEAAKYFLQTGQLLTNKILAFDAQTTSFKTLNFKQNKNCPVCGINPSITKPQEVLEQTCTVRT